MAAIAKSGVPSLASALPPQNEQIPGLLAGEAIGAGDIVMIAGTGRAMKRTATNRAVGWAGVPASSGEAVTIYRNLRCAYGSGMTPGTLVYTSNTVAGGIDTTAATEQLVGIAVDAYRIQFFGF